MGEQKVKFPSCFLLSEAGSQVRTMLRKSPKHILRFSVQGFQVAGADQYSGQACTLRYLRVSLESRGPVKTSPQVQRDFGDHSFTSCLILC